MHFLLRLADYHNEQSNPDENVVLSKFKKVTEIQHNNVKENTLASFHSKGITQPTLPSSQQLPVSQLPISGDLANQRANKLFQVSK